MTKKLAIVGAGGFAREVACLVDDINRVEKRWDLLGYVDADAKLKGSILCRRPVLGGDDVIAEYNGPLSVAIGIGSPQVISKISARSSALDHVTFPNLIHPNVVYDAEGVSMGVGNIVTAGNILTTGISLGSFNIINLACTIGHDTQIGDHCVLNPGVNVSGGVTIGERCLIGTGATILQNRRIGPGSTVGAGALVAKDVEPGTTVVGVPAKPIPPKEPRS